MTRNERATLMSPLSMPKQVLKATKWSAKPTRLSFKTIGMFYLLNVIILWPLSYLMSHFVGLGVSVRILPFLVLILVILEYLATVSIKETKGGAEEDAEEAEGWVWFKRALVKAFDSRKLISIKRAFPPQKLSVGNSGGVAKNSHHSKNDFSKMDLRDKIFKRKDLRKAI